MLRRRGVLKKALRARRGKPLRYAGLEGGYLQKEGDYRMVAIAELSLKRESSAHCGVLRHKKAGLWPASLCVQIIDFYCIFIFYPVMTHNMTHSLTVGFQ